MDALFVTLIFIAMVVFVGAFIVESIKGRFELDTLLSTGTRVSGKLVEVGTGTPAGRSNHTRFYVQPITFQFEGATGEQTVKTQVVVPEMLQSLLQAGAPAQIEPPSGNHFSRRSPPAEPPVYRGAPDVYRAGSAHEVLLMRLLSSLCRGVLPTLLALHTPPALAHLGYPDTTSVTVRRGHPEDMFVGATFGAVISRDSGKTWHWICPEAMNYGGWRPETFLWQADGTLLAATGAALIRSHDGGCSWTVHDYFKSRGLWPTGLASPGSNPSRLWVATARAGTPNGVYRSDDGGETFTPTSLQSDTAVFTAVKVAPSDPRRIYVSGGTSDGQRIHRSDDEGATWEEISHPFPEYASQYTRAYDLFVLRVSDTDPDRLWARVSWEGWTYVLESKDGGRTFRSILHPEGQDRDAIDEYLMGIEVSADGNTLWAATPTRLFRVRTGDTYATQLPLPDGNACVQREGDTLFVCGASRVHDWALATTPDEGQTYTPLLNLPDTQPPACPYATPVYDLCRPLWPQFAPTIEANPTLPPGDGGTPDAGPSEPPPAPPRKEGCSSASGLLPAACLLAISILRRPRRRNPENRHP